MLPLLFGLFGQVFSHLIAEKLFHFLAEHFAFLSQGFSLGGFEDFMREGCCCSSADKSNQCFHIHEDGGYPHDICIVR